MAMDRSPPGSPPLSSMRHGSASPPPHREAHLSKRDKRRTMLQERLADMTAQFTHTRDQHYREQLQALQLDMNLIMEADCYSDVPIISDPAGIDQLVMVGMSKMKNVGPNPPPGAGRLYARWAKGINDNVEERDANLVIHKRNYDNKLNEVNAAHSYRHKVATEEHKALSKTLRDRLINSITMKKNRLAKDKDNVEIGESSAALLHPSQYGHNNPASPGGIHGKRASRHRRDVEDVSGLDSNKRKRRMGEEESPAPSRQRIENGSGTPLWFAEKQAMISKQLDAPVFSIDKLFTEKELALTYNTACIAAHNHMVRHPPYTDDLDSPPNGKSDSSSDQEKATNGVDGEAEEADSPPAGAAMERQYSHATRSTRANYVTGLGIDAIADINAPGNFQALTKQVPKLPPFLSYGTTKIYSKGEASNTPAPLPYDDVQAEMDLIRRARLYNAEKGLGSNLELENGGRTILEMACEPRRFDYWIASDNRNALDKGHGGRDKREAGDESDVSPIKGGGLGGVDMERMHSGRSAISDVGYGGTPMSRTNTGDGGAGSARRRNGVRREL